MTADFWRRFIADEAGQDLVEYALLVSAIALGLITSVHTMTDQIGSLYQSMTSEIQGLSQPTHFEWLQGTGQG